MLSLIKPIWKFELRLITATIEKTVRKITNLLKNHLSRQESLPTIELIDFDNEYVVDVTESTPTI